MNIKQGAHKSVWSMVVAILTFGVLTEVSAQQLQRRSARKPHTVLGGTFYSLTLNQPPFPFNPFPELPVYFIGDGKLAYDDRSVDYLQLRAETAAKQAEEQAMMKTTQASMEESMGGGGMALMMGGGGLQLVIERTDLDGKKVSFNTQPGVVYEIQQSSDLQNWSLLQRMVANETTASFHAFNQGNQFYRVLQGDDSIQFPEWEGFIEQYMHFDVWTPVQGIYHLELYSDGSLAYQTTQPIPADGFFGVYDPAYNPNEWPFTGYYGVNEWELRVTVTPSAAGAAATQATVTKKQRRRNQTRIGTTVQQYNAFSISYLIQEEIDDWMLYYFLANMQASRQVALDGSNLNEFIAAGAVPRLISNNDWANLKNLIYGPASSVRLSDLHYFGHGTNTHIGSFSNPARRISLSELTGSLLATSPMRYVALDGCKTAETTDFLKAWVGHGSKYSRQHFLDKGWDPVFAWGWKNAKPVAFERQGILLDEHFWFVADYYWFLTQRDLGGNGYLFHTYQESILFGQNPGGGSPYHTRTRNTEGDSINYVGCYDCVFDLP